MAELFLGRNVAAKMTFIEKGIFQSMYAAQGWCSAHGYSYGSGSKDRMSGRNLPTAIVKGEYNLPQKWHNMEEEEQNGVDGVMVSHDWREGTVHIYIFETAH